MTAKLVTYSPEQDRYISKSLKKGKTYKFWALGWPKLVKVTAK